MNQLPMLLTQHWFWYPEEQIEGIYDTPKTLRWHYKKRKQKTVKDIQPQSIEVKILEKTLPEFKRGEKRGKTTFEILKMPLEITLESKRI